jgi:prepilin-type N-terminal cleavage/methylation domain-containing protein
MVMKWKQRSGGSCSGHRPQASSLSAEGFTLIEVLIVIAILSLLIGSIVVVATGVSGKAMKRGTEGILLEIAAALQGYFNEFREYPPDGYDFPVVARNGQQLKGSACLTYFLAWKYADGGDFKSFDLKRIEYTDSDNLREVPVNNNQPFWDGVKQEYLNKYGEVVDKWRNPIRYDNCELDKNKKPLYSPNIQPMAGGKDPDPREATNNGRPYNRGECDMWSCGANGNTDETDAKDDIIAGREQTR